MWGVEVVTWDVRAVIKLKISMTVRITDKMSKIYSRKNEKQEKNTF